MAATHIFCRLVAILAILFVTLLSSAQRPASAQPAELAPGGIGSTGLSFAYRSTTGVVEVPYLDVATHLNQPLRVRIDSSGALWIVEGEGSRVLKYFNGAHQLTLGKVGIHRYGEETFHAPEDVATAPDGHVWVADASRLIEFDSNGQFVRNLPAQGFESPSQAAGRFMRASALVFDAQGFLYVADPQANRVQVFRWQTGSAPVYQAALTGFAEPLRLSVQPNGTLLVVDQNGIQRCVYKTSLQWDCSVYLNLPDHIWDAAFTPQNEVVLLRAGTRDGSGPSTVYRCPEHLLPQCSLVTTTQSRASTLALDSAGAIYNAAPENHIIEKFSPAEARQEIVYGTLDQPLLTDEAHFYAPLVKVDPHDNRYVLEMRGCRLRKYAPSGALLWTYGEAGTCRSASNQLTRPNDLDFAADGTIFIADQWRVLMLDPLDGMPFYRIGLDQPATTGPFHDLSAAALNRTSERVYIADRDLAGQGVSIYSQSGIFVRQMLPIRANCDPASNTNVCQPSAIAVDANGDVYIADTGKQAILKFDAQDHFLFRIEGQRHHAVQQVDDLMVDTNGNLYVTDSALRRVQVFDRTGAYLATIGGSTGSGPGAFFQPSGTTIDPYGNVLVSDAANASWQVYRRGLDGWQQSNINGFGEQGNTILQALAVHQSTLYALARSTSGGSLWQSTDGAQWQHVRGFSGQQPMALQSFETGLFVAVGNSLMRYDGSSWQYPVQLASGGAWLGAMTVFGDHLYIAVNRSAGGEVEILRVAPGGVLTTTSAVGNGSENNLSVSGFGVFQNQLYVAIANAVEGPEIWRSTPTGTGWERLIRGGLTIEGQRCTHFGSLVEFRSTLYLTANCASTARLLQSQNGSAWIAAPSPAFAPGSSLDLLAVHNQQLITGLSAAQGVQLYASMDGTAWTALNETGFGEPFATSLHAQAAAVFDGQRYIGIDHPAKGGQVWRQTAPPPADDRIKRYLPLLWR